MKAKINIKSLFTVLIAIFTASHALAEKVIVDPAIAPYKVETGISGTLNSIGSDTLNNVMILWIEGFKKKYPGVNIQVEGKGSATAPPALIEGSAQLGPMSRPLKDDEIDKFEKKFGYKPTEVKVAIDALAVFANKDAPLKGLTMQQVDSIFSSTLKAGGKNITKWGDIGVKEWANTPISLFGRNSASGTYGFFKDHALFKGELKPTVKEQPGSSAVVHEVSLNKYALGYSGIGYATPGVKAVPLATKSGLEFTEPSHENCLTGDYPLARFLYVYINKKPLAPIDKLTGAFIDYVLSKEGQEIVVKGGYYPITSETVKEWKSTR